MPAGNQDTSAGTPGKEVLSLPPLQYCKLVLGFWVSTITYNIQLLGVYIHYSQCIYYGMFHVNWL